MKEKLLPLMMLILSACTTKGTITDATVSITNLKGNSGGSGSIVDYSNTESKILTNAHVCGVVKHGGMVNTADGASHFVTSYKVSEIHDLCLISVAANLGTKVSLAHNVPVMFDDVMVAGHPRLLPTILTYGHFSDKKIVPIMVGSRECTDSEKADPGLGFICMFLGRLPIIKYYDSIVTSALIQPGSSGSAVYDGGGRIAAVVFAGQGDIGFGLAVPFEYVHRFLTVESANLNSKVPEFSLSLSSSSPETDSFTEEKIKEACKEIKSETQRDICDRVKETLKYSNLIELN